MSQLKISDEKIAEFQANGAVLLQDVFSKKWVDLVRDGVELNMKNPSEFGEWLKVIAAMPFLFKKQRIFTH